jgi:hypothetical protein
MPFTIVAKPATDDRRLLFNKGARCFRAQFPLRSVNPLPCAYNASHICGWPIAAAFPGLSGLWSTGSAI